MKDLNKITTNMMEHVCDKLCYYPKTVTDQDQMNDICAACKMGQFVCDICNTWISCSERMPECEEIVLIQVSGRFRNIVFEDAFEMAEYTSNDGRVLESYPEWVNPNVIAWMPLPETYKEAID